MSTMAPVPKDHPLMLAWEAHKKTEEYANSRNWAANPQHVDGSLWALFSAGWQAAQPAQSVDVRDVVLKSLGGYLERHWPDNPVSYDDMADKLTAALQEKGNG